MTDRERETDEEEERWKVEVIERERNKWRE